MIYSLPAFGEATVAEYRKLAKPPAKPPQELLDAYYHDQRQQRCVRTEEMGEGVYRIGDGQPFTLTTNQDEAIVLAIKNGGAISKQKLVDELGDEAPRDFKLASEKLARFAGCPGKRGQGGYWVNRIDLA